MRNWFREIKNWLTSRFAKLVKSINVNMVEAKPAPALADEINFQASKLRKKRPIASTISRQSSITITVPPRTKTDEAESSAEETIATTSAATSVEAELVEKQLEVESAEVFTEEFIEAELPKAEIIEDEIIEDGLVEAEMHVKESTPFDEETADEESSDPVAEVSEEETVPQSEAAQALAEMAAIQATQSEAIFTVVNAADGLIEVQVRGETMSLAAALETLLFVSDTAVDVGQFVKLFSLDAAVIEAELHKLGEGFKQSGRGIRLQEQNGRYRLISLPAAANLIETFLNLDLTTRLSGPALETLSVIAYRQPVTRAQIEAVRGVDCGYVLRSLLQRGLVEESGRLETVGRPILYGVTEQFMQHFGLTNLNDLPPLESTEAALLMQVTEMEEAE